MEAVITVRVPASSANLGPGFDCLAMAFDLWNEVTFYPAESGIALAVEGEGRGRLPLDSSNLVIRALSAVYERFQLPLPEVDIRCTNQIPLGSGLGSSAASLLAGLLGANELIGRQMSRSEILAMAIEMEGHPDNVTAAMYGGLVVAMNDGKSGWFVRRFDVPTWKSVLVLPAIQLSTETSRAALPRQVNLQDAVYNLGRVGLVIEALRTGDLPLLNVVMGDRLHQPYRLPLIPGAAEAIAAANRLGAAATLSGAGPGVIAFAAQEPATIGRAMTAQFDLEGIQSQAYTLQTTNEGAQVVL